MNSFTVPAKLEEQNCPFSMAQIVDSRGSTPRHSAQMLVRADANGRRCRLMNSGG